MIIENVSLKPFNTFGLEATAKRFCTVKNEEQLSTLFDQGHIQNQNLQVLGGGSNILLLNDVDALVLKMEIGGLTKVNETATEVFLAVGAGVVWHELVVYCIENNWAGLENLSLIPGTAGAAPMQNIGAYGVEVKEVFYCLRAFNRLSGTFEVFDNEQCRFAYRESFFKNEGKGKYIITEVTFRLSKQPSFKTTYGVINDTLQEMGVKNMSIKAVSEAVIKIRKSKLPDPAEIGNAGSFFKNPEIQRSLLNDLQQHYPQIPFYEISESIVKVPAGWLIEKAGWKGYRRGQIGVHEKQALVLVNYGGGKGLDILTLAKEIQASVYEKFGIEIKPEVNLV
jgi:UDP-N-acetylmuramate dehydrogenase